MEVRYAAISLAVWAFSFPFGRTSGPDLATRSGSGYSVRAWLQSDATPVANHVFRGRASPKLVAKMEIPE